MDARRDQRERRLQLVDDEGPVERDVPELLGDLARRPVDLELDGSRRLPEPHLLLQAVAAEARVHADEGEDLALAAAGLLARFGARFLEGRADARADAEAVRLVADQAHGEPVVAVAGVL